MKLFIVLSAFIVATTPVFSADTRHLLILEEIQKSIVKDFGLEGETKLVVTKGDEEPPKKELTKGEKRVQEQLRKNREKIRRQQGNVGKKKLSGKERIEEMLRKNREKIKKMKEQKKTGKSKDWASSKLKEQSSWEDSSKKQVSSWEEEKKKIINRWIADKKKYLKRIPGYKENLVSLDEEVKEEVKDIEQVEKVEKRKPKKVTYKKVKMPVFDDYQIIDNAFAFDVKDQGRRPTCAAFAGTRALEIVLSRGRGYKKLSEQYFFWSSKPKCQKSPCPKQGSWVLNGYRTSQKASAPNIPLDRDCGYRKKAKSNNVTQIPLAGGCFRGYAQVRDYEMVKSMPEILTAIKANKPVVGGFRLSPNFYRNNGYVFLQQDKQRGRVDSHAAGHAILLVGHMKLPKKLHRSEGRFCLIAANSWGIGWGKGGHACLSEKWIEKYRYDMAFAAVKRVNSI